MSQVQESQMQEFKQGARTIWAAGDYDAMMRREGLYEIGDRIVQLAGVQAGEVVLDVACGTGNAAIPAARAQAVVTGLDLTPELLAVANRRAVDAGVRVTWVEGDAEELPFDDASVDVVLSTFGVMFAPRHEVVADEIARVLRPGGRLAGCAWTPEGTIGDFFRIASEYLPASPSFVDPPLAWGAEQRVRELFEGTGVTCEFTREEAGLRHRSVESAVECYVSYFGPMVMARAAADEQGRWPAMRNDLAALFGQHSRASEGGIVFPAEYLAVLGRKA
jgi:ubiquinone/menaquinone biosynthesis C-methylase UbiE